MTLSTGSRLALTWVLLHLWSASCRVTALLDDGPDDAVAAHDDEFAAIGAFFPPPPLGSRYLQTTTEESTHVNIWEKLRESLGLAIIGCLLICIMPCVIWKNEGRHVRELARIDFCKNQAVVVEADAPDSKYLERLVHFTGSVQVGDKALQFGSAKAGKDDDDDKDTLNVTAPVPRAILLKRTCYIYQKFEDVQQKTDRDRIGGGETRTTLYTLREDWTALGPQPERLPHLTDETNSRGIWDSLVKAASGGGQVDATTTTTSPQTNIPNLPNELPPEMVEKLGLLDTSQPPHGQAVSPATRVGEFSLSSDLILQHPHVFASDLLPVPAEYLPERVEGVLRLRKGSDNVLRNFSPDDGPQNGDCKVVYEYASDGFDCSFIVQQILAHDDASSPSSDKKEDLEEGGGDGGDTMFGVDKCKAVDERCFGQWNTDLGEIWMVQKGQHSVTDMIDFAKEEEKKVVMMIRLVAWVLLLVGWIMLFSPFSTALQVLPILSQLGYFAVVLTAIIVSCLCCSTVTLLAYFRYRPLLSGILLAVALGIWGIVIWKLDEAADEGGSEDSS